MEVTHKKLGALDVAAQGYVLLFTVGFSLAIDDRQDEYVAFRKSVADFQKGWKTIALANKTCFFFVNLNNVFDDFFKNIFRNITDIQVRY